MPKGPQGQKRPADVIGNAVHVMRIATGEVEETTRNAGAEANRKVGLKGGTARAEKLSPKRRKEIATLAASKAMNQTVTPPTFCTGWQAAIMPSHSLSPALMRRQIAAACRE
jgi:hypothetical protein